MSKHIIAPPVRFQGFTEPWKQRKLGDMMDVTSVKRIHQSDWMDSGVRFLRARDIVAESKNEEVSEPLFISQEKYDEYSAISGKVEKGDLLVTGVGTIGVPMLINSEEPLYFKDGNIIWFKNKNAIDGRFFYHSFNGLNIQKFIKESAGTGTVGTYTIETGKKTPINLPPQKEEQEKIGLYFSNLDNLLTLHQRKLELMKKLKAFFLKNMFPEEGETVPRIRFKGFTGDWEWRKFGEIAEYKKGPFGSALKKDFFIPDSATSVKVYEQQNAINKNWNLSRYYISKEYAQKLKSFEVHAGDIIVSCAGTIGEIYELPAQSRSGIINQALMRIRVNEDIVCKDIFKLAFSNMIDSFSREFSNGSAIKNIPPFADLKPMKILLPNKAEQTIIGDFFTDIDKTITLHQRKIDQLQAMKKFMLQNLFV